MLDALPAERLLEASEERFFENQALVYFHESLVCGQARSTLPHADSFVSAFSGPDNLAGSRK